MELEVFKGNSLIVESYNEPVKTIEEGIERIKRIKQDYEKIVEAVTERKFYLEGKTLLEMKKLHFKTDDNGEFVYGEGGRLVPITGDWVKTCVESGYNQQHQVNTLINKYLLAENFITVNRNQIPDGNLETVNDNIEKLSRSETFELSKLPLDIQKQILETENAKTELKKLREELALKKEMGEENFKLKKELEEKEKDLNAINFELALLSKEMNNRPVIEKEKVVERIVRDEVKPADYDELKRKAKEYEDKKREIEKKTSELSQKLVANMQGAGLVADVRTIFMNKDGGLNSLDSLIRILERVKEHQDGHEIMKEYGKARQLLTARAEKILELVNEIYNVDYVEVIEC